MVINLVFIPVESKRRWFAGRTAKVTTLLLLRTVQLYRAGDRSLLSRCDRALTSLKHHRVGLHRLHGPAGSGEQRTRAIGR